MTVWTWSKTANSNATADSTINYAEGMAGKQLNDSGRALMAAVAKYRDDQACAGTTGGTATAYTITTNQGLTALTDRFAVSFVAHATNTGYATLQVDSTTAKPLSLVAGEDLPGGSVIIGHTYRAYYSAASAAYLLEASPFVEVPTFASGTAMLFVQTSAPTGWTKSTSHNDKALRVVSGTASSGGSTAFSSVFTARTISQANIPSYTLSGQTQDSSPIFTYGYAGAAGGGSNFVAYLDASAYGSNCGTQPHHHIFSLNSGGSGTAMDFAVRYVDAIIATKD